MVIPLTLDYVQDNVLKFMLSTISVHGSNSMVKLRLRN